MNDPRQRDLGTLLRREFEGPVADDGFSDRVMRRLPPRRSLRWPLWLGLSVGAGAAGWALAQTPLLRVGWQEWLAGQFSAAGIGMWLMSMGIAWLVAAWALSADASR
ncbi:hypothetical protein SQW19_09300 [Stenotrophomonas acidaminiphila]|uniref:hypothetical protein n=1 Tax=Stenotrophomonas TaxID=40323 RepID=UPI001D5F31CC|nr:MULTISPECIES: hypothetical protein [Stenotrophomonas]MCH1908269.1 hypothetical protein [Stenotrophomonas sp. Y6]MPS34427.1 hypothetical protein [Stenotrophomonas sp.]WPU54569.1 hypothetical protein SQW19_09300 [Stenotrophomonas acidaminiphila]